MGESRPTLFLGRHFREEIIVLCLRWYLRYPLSYRDLEEMMAERGLSVDHSTIARWVLHYSPVLNERIRYQMRNRNRSWRVDETTSASRVAGRTCIGRFAQACELPTKTVRAIIAALGTIAVHEVKKNGVFVVPGIGRLVKVDRKARMGRNPATGESIKIAAKKVVKFRIAKSVKDAVIPPPKVKK